MNVFDYFFESTQDLEKDFVLGSKESISFSKLYSDSLILASYLKKTIGTGQNVLIICPNSIFLLTAYLAILKSGNVCVPLNFAIKQNNLDYIINTTESKSVFISKNLKKKLNFAEDIHLIDEEESAQVLQKGTKLKFDLRFNENSLAEIIFTSGSTGEPKGVMISHRNIIANTNSIIDYLKLTQDDIMLVVLPFFYCYGLSLLHTHLKVGGSIVLNNTFIFLGSVMNDLKNHKCTGFAGVPSHFQILLKKSQTFKSTDFPDLKYVTQAGGKLHAIFVRDFVESFPNVDFYIMYGQTEATARLSYLEPELVKEKDTSIGKAIPGVEFKIVNDNGELVGIGEEGELLAKGDNIMLGYYKDEEGTLKTLDGGWLHTGDMAKIDEEGFFYLVARKKEIIKVGGKRVSPKEIEEVILSLPEVVDCTIRGVDDDILGEAIQATIILNGKYDEVLMNEKVLKTCSKSLAHFKIPQNLIFETNIRISSTGKKIK